MSKPIASLRHRVALCTQRDVVEEGTDLRIVRQGVMNMWASIEPKKASTFTPRGAASQESRNTRTHIICTRYHRDVDVSHLAWLYEERRKSAPRWFKILSVVQSERSGSEYFMFDCRLTERGEGLAEPTAELSGPVVGMPEGVTL